MWWEETELYCKKDILGNPLTHIVLMGKYVASSYVKDWRWGSQFNYFLGQRKGQPEETHSGHEIIWHCSFLYGSNKTRYNGVNTSLRAGASPAVSRFYANLVDG